MDAQKLKYMADIKATFIGHLEKELKIVEDALDGYKTLTSNLANKEEDADIRMMREFERIKLESLQSFIKRQIETFKLIK